MINCVISAKIDRLPLRCNECPFFTLSNYHCHNESGQEGGCELGYMKHYDMRDFTGVYLFNGCQIANNPNITIGK